MPKDYSKYSDEELLGMYNSIQQQSEPQQQVQPPPEDSLMRNAGLGTRAIINAAASPATLIAGGINRVAGHLGYDAPLPDVHADLNKKLDGLGLPNAYSTGEKIVQDIGRSAATMLIPGGAVRQIAGNVGAQYAMGSEQDPRAAATILGGTLGSAGMLANRVGTPILNKFMPQTVTMSDRIKDFAYAIMSGKIHAQKVNAAMNATANTANDL